MRAAKVMHMLGLSFRTASLAVREAFQYDAVAAGDLLRNAASQMPDCEALVLSTCNRTEFYLAAPSGGSCVEQWLNLIRRQRPTAPIHDANCLRQMAQGDNAIRHLLRVTCGLDSAVLGDLQILSQVREAVGVAGKAGTLGYYLNQAFAQGLRVGREARRKTGISCGSASVGSAVAELVARSIAAAEGRELPRITILGAGQIARDVAWNLSKRRQGRLFIVNRTLDRARALAEHCGGEALPWTELQSAISATDAIIAATSAAEPILTDRHFALLSSERSRAMPLIVDTGLPRNVALLEQVRVINIDEIREEREQILAQRHAAIPQVEALIDHEMDLWRQWQATQPFEEAIAAMYQQVGDLGRMATAELANGSESTRQIAEEQLARLVRRALHNPVRRLRELQGQFQVASDNAISEVASCPGD